MKTHRVALLFTSLILPVILFAQTAYDYAGIYSVVSPAIVSITTDDSTGSGFLVTTYGHIVTNYHVVQNSRYLAVQFSDGRKVTAAIVALNPHFDMAILKVNSKVVEGVQPLPVVSIEEETSVRVGIPVLALGSPLDKKFMMTQGILSRIDDDTILGDFVLQPGSSGGPLLNCAGQVIGINTFGEGSVGGAIRIGILREFLESSQIAESFDVEPSPLPLPSLGARRYPVSVLRHKINSEPFDLTAYKLEAGDFEITAITPVLIGQVGVVRQRMRAANRLERRTKNITDPSYRGMNNVYFQWRSSVEPALEYAVTFDIRPRMGLTGRGKLSRPLGVFRIFGVDAPLDKEFLGEFLEFRIYRDGKLLEPVLPGRTLVEGTTDKKSRLIDEAFAGSYVYNPDDFLTGEEFRLQIIDARHPDQVHKELVLKADSPLIRQLRSDFTLNQGSSK